MEAGLYQCLQAWPRGSCIHALPGLAPGHCGFASLLCDVGGVGTVPGRSAILLPTIGKPPILHGSLTGTCGVSLRSTHTHPLNMRQSKASFPSRCSMHFHNNQDLLPLETPCDLNQQQTPKDKMDNASMRHPGALLSLHKRATRVTGRGYTSTGVGKRLL